MNPQPTDLERKGSKSSVFRQIYMLTDATDVILSWSFEMVEMAPRPTGWERKGSESCVLCQTYICIIKVYLFFGNKLMHIYNENCEMAIAISSSWASVP